MNKVRTFNIGPNIYIYIFPIRRTRNCNQNENKVHKGQTTVGKSVF